MSGSTKLQLLVDSGTVYAPKVARGFNIQSGQEYQINGVSINTAGTLTNVIYHNAGRSGGSVIIGGTATTDGLTLQTTSGVGTTGADIHFLVGNNGATEAMTILNSGNVGIGTTSPSDILHIVKAGSYSSIIQVAAGRAELNFKRSNGTIAVPTNVSDGQTIMEIAAESYSGATGFWEGLSILGAIDGTVTDNQRPPTRLQIYTNPANGVSAERMRIDSAGNIGFNQTTFGTNATKVLAIANGTAPTTSPADAVQMWSADRGETAGKAGLHIRSEDGTSHVFSDLVGIGNTAPAALLTLGTAGSKAGTISLAGITSGVITLQTAAEAGTYTLTLPTAVGGAGTSLTDANGDGTLSWVGLLPLTGGTMTGNITLGENATIELDPKLSADGKYNGITITGTCGETLAFGDVIVLDPTAGLWFKADISAVAAADGDARGMIGMCVLAGNVNDATNILLQGTIRADTNFPALTSGVPIYASTTGDIVTTQSDTTDYIIRLLGFAIVDDLSMTEPQSIYFNPSNDYITHV